MTMPQYDFEDHLIEKMVGWHRPTELIVSTASGEKIVWSVVCDTCQGTWPCSPVQALRQWRVDHGNPAEHDG